MAGLSGSIYLESGISQRFGFIETILDKGRNDGQQLQEPMAMFVMELCLFFDNSVKDSTWTCRVGIFC